MFGGVLSPIIKKYPCFDMKRRFILRLNLFHAFIFIQKEKKVSKIKKSNFGELDWNLITLSLGQVR